MAGEESDICDLNDINLQPDDVTKNQDNGKLKKRPKRILHFSDGVLEEYSSEDEVDNMKNGNVAEQIDPKTLNWLPWTWYQTTCVGSKLLNGCDYVGECLASFFGITSPKYQFEIEEYYRQRELEQKEKYQEDLELGGWDEQKRNNLININKSPMSNAVPLQN